MKSRSEQVYSNSEIGPYTTIAADGTDDDFADGEQSDSGEGSGDERKLSGPVTRSKARSTRPMKPVGMIPKTKQSTDAEHKKPHTCPWPDCGQRFGRKDHLKRHLSNHSDKKPFQCPVPLCGHATKRKDNLQEHLRLRHKLNARAAKRSADEAVQAAHEEMLTIAAAAETTLANVKSGTETQSKSISAGDDEYEVGHDANATSRMLPLTLGDDEDEPGTVLLRAAYNAWRSDSDSDMGD